MNFKKIKLEVVNGIENIDITQLIKKVEWSGSYQQACRKLLFSVLASPCDKSIPKVNIECGYMIRLFEDDKELFRGYMQSKSISYNSSTIEYMALDGGTYVHRNELVYNFKNLSAEEITSKVCNDLGVQTGNIASTNLKMDKKFFGASGYDIIMTAYTYASAKNNKKYMCTMDKGLLNVIEKGKVVLDLSFENGSNILDSEFSEDISNMINTVKVYNGDKQLVKTVKNDSDIKAYGTFSKVLKLEDGKDIDAEAKKELKKIERKASISGFGDSSCKCGYGVKVKDAYTNLVGLFYIDEDVHTWENGMYSVDLTLAFENMMHEVNSEETENETQSNTQTSNESNSSDSGNASSSSSGGNQRLVELAKSKLGCKYVWGATGPNTFDCSGLTSWCHKQIGISIPRTALAQSKSGKSVSKSNLQPGDLIFWKTTSAPVGHVGMYVGNGQFIHAPNKSKPVKYDSLSSSYYSSRYVCARRYW